MARDVLVVGIAGGSGSGKTTVVRAISEAFGNAVAVLEHDAYYRDQSCLSFDERLKTNYDHPFAFDTDLYIDHAEQLVSGRAVDRPVYSFESYTRTSDTVCVRPAGVLILEGILVLEDARIRELMDIKAFVDADPDVRFIRRLMRDVQDRGRTLDSVVDQYLNVVRPMHLQFVEPTKRYADVIIPEGGFNRVAIELLIARLKSAV
ncbi:MAG TPA: uridine kinase [Bacillota bacterium]|jgi:uridine kinase|nr:uridine kinase [Bacillota bacterium]HOI37753.1 uridine kinase [Bacillota bacterium]